MIVSAPIADAFRAVPDTASVSSPNSGASTYVNFRSVLDQYHSPPERDSKTDGAQGGTGLPSVSTPAQDASFAPEAGPQSAQTAGAIGATDTTPVPSAESGTSTPVNFRKVLDQDRPSPERDSKADVTQSDRQQRQKDSGPTQTVAASLFATQTAEPPLLILPFSASTTWGQDGAALKNGSAATFVPETDSESARTAGTVGAITDSAAVSSRRGGITASTNAGNVLEQYHLSREHDSETDGAVGSDQRTRKHLNPTQTVAAVFPTTPPDELSRTILPLAASVAVRQDGAALEHGFAAPFAPETNLEFAPKAGSVLSIAESTAVLSLGGTVFTGTNSRQVADQYRFSREHDTETDGAISSNRRTQKDSESTPTVTAPLPATQTADTPRIILPVTASIVPQDGTASQNSFDAAQDATFAPVADPKVTTPPAPEQLDATPASPVGPLAFAARLSPNTETQQPALNAIRTAEPQPGAQTSQQIAAQVTAKQVAAGADVAADSHTDQGGDQSAKEKMGDRFAKPDVHLPQAHAAVQDRTATPGHNETPPGQLSPTARMEKGIDPPATPPSTNRDITIRIPDSTDQGIAVRFVERAGEVHVSVRTGDAEMAQSLRGGLNDLANRLEDGGIRTEVWQPGSNASSSENDSRNQFADPDGSNGRQYSSGSNPEQESRKQNQPRRLEEMEGSIGNQDFKETAHLLWQA
jgi:hypothetical protein